MTQGWLGKHLLIPTLLIGFLTIVLLVIRVFFIKNDYAPEIIAGLGDGSYISINGREVRAINNYLQGSSYSRSQLETMCPNDDLSELSLRATPQADGNVLGNSMIVLMIAEAGERCIPLDEKDHVRDQLVFRAKQAAKSVSLPDQASNTIVQEFSVAQASNLVQQILDVAIFFLSLVTGALVGALVGRWTGSHQAGGTP